MMVIGFLRRALESAAVLCHFEVQHQGLGEASQCPELIKCSHVGLETTKCTIVSQYLVRVNNSVAVSVRNCD